MVRTLVNHGSQVLPTPMGIAGLDLDDPEKRPSVVMAGVELQDEGQLFARAPGVAAQPQ
jgi:hypothetical protein